ncbi:28S rRNA (uridine-N(3))-methyltransferase-like isoform X2 [Saccoglossus kowalevskii]
MEDSAVSKSMKRPTPDSPASEWKKWKHEVRKNRTRQVDVDLEKQHRKEAAQRIAIEEEKQRQKEEEELKKKIGYNHTISIALPGSILDNAQSPELRTYLAGQIARACVIFKVDEIIIFDEAGFSSEYLRKHFFPKHSDLQYAGVLNPLDTPHHMRIDDECEFREGVVLDRPVKGGKGSFVNAGLRKEIRIDRQLRDGLRVTVRLDNKQTDEDRRYYTGKVVSPRCPCTDRGLYWGYTVRLASSLSKVFTESSYKNGYDLTIGTSDSGDDIDHATFSKFNHALVVFGGLKGLEYSLDCDEKLKIHEVNDLFDMYINTCPKQGSRTIRTEEAILITMAALRPRIIQALNT